MGKQIQHRPVWGCLSTYLCVQLVGHILEQHVKFRIEQFQAMSGRCSVSSIGQTAEWRVQ